jgi:hypothetical protein
MPRGKATKKKTEFKGKNVTYDTIYTLKNKLKVTKDEAKLIRDSDKIDLIAVNKLTNEIARINLKKDKPLLLRQFGIKSAKNKDLLAALNNNVNNPKYFLGKEIPENISSELVVTYYVAIRDPSTDEILVRKHTTEVRSSPNNIQDFISRDAFEYYEDILSDETYVEANDLNPLEIFNPYTGQNEEWTSNPKIQTINSKKFQNQEFKLEDMKLREEDPLLLNNLFTNVDLNNNKDCVKAALKTTLSKTKNLKRGEKKKLLDDLDSLGNKDGVTIDELYQYCVNHLVKLVCYDINGKVIKQNLNGHKYIPTLYFLCYNNHLYIVKNKYLEKKEVNVKEVKIVENVHIELNKLLKAKRVPSNVNYDGIKITSFVDEDIKYIENTEYLRCKEILDKNGMGDKIFDNISIFSIYSVFENVFFKEDPSSFFPHCPKHTPIVYKSSRVVENVKEVSTIDKNKAYAYSMFDLSFLIKVDIRSAKMNSDLTYLSGLTKYVDHHLYLAKPKYYSIVMRQMGLYSGEHLNFCKKEEVEFDVIFEIEATKMQNYAASMIKILRENLNDTEFKHMMVVSMGRLEETAKSFTKYEVDGFFNKDEAVRREGYMEKEFGKYSLMYRCVNGVRNIYNKIPIKNQILENHSRMVYNKLKELKINEEDIIQIKTDSISYVGKLPKGLDKTDFTGWKKETFKPMKKISEDFDQRELTIESLFPHDVTNGEIAMCYAGAGKTYKIINEVIPKLVQSDTSYIILTPSHASKKEYHAAGLNCDVIQRYTLHNRIPDVEHIIVDEFGMCDSYAHDLVYKCKFLGRIVDVYGDFKQLPPVEGNIMDNKYYLNSMFSTTIKMEENRRNNFTKQYYDTLIDGIADYKQEVFKHSNSFSDLENAEVIICYRNATVDKYNKMMLGIKGLEHFSIGAKVICTTNNLRDKNIYNGFNFTISEHLEEIIYDDKTKKYFKMENGKEVKFDKEDEAIILDDGTKLTIDEFKNNFKPAYAQTLHKLQGATIKSYYFPEDDQKFITPKAAYTIVSRLKK